MIFKAPAPLPAEFSGPSVFLGGSIDMGNAEFWQERVAKKILSCRPEISILDPRRDDWDASWKQTPEDAQFCEQVNWELDGQERATVRGYYFSASSKSPITLLEFGLFHALPTVVFCPESFYRSGNIYIVARRYGVAVTHSESEWIELLLRHCGSV